MKLANYKFIPKSCKFLEEQVNSILVDFNNEKKAPQPQLDINYVKGSNDYRVIRENIYRRLKDWFTDINSRYNSAQDLVSKVHSFKYELIKYTPFFNRDLKNENYDLYLLSVDINNVRIKILDILTTFINSAEQEDRTLTNRIFVSFNLNAYKAQFNFLREELKDKYTFYTHDAQSERRFIGIDKIRADIYDARAFILFVGEDFTNEKWVVEEINIAREADKPIIFVRLDPNIPKPVESFEYIWVDNFDIEKIKKALDGASQMENISIQMLADFAIENSSEDLLNFSAYSSAIVGIIDKPETGTPLTIAINAPWGAGKSSLGKLIQDKLNAKPASSGKYPHVTCWFDAWMHDDAQNIGSSFISFLIHEVNRKRSWFNRFINPMPYDILSKNEKTFRKSIYWIVVVSTSIVLSFFFVSLVNNSGVFSKDLSTIIKSIPNLYENNILEYSSIALFFVTLIKIATYLLQAVKSVSSYINDPAETAKTGQLEKTRNQLRRFIKQSLPKGSRFVIFVDDIERCHPPSGIDLLEIINQLLGFPDVIVVVMADMPLLAANAEIKYDKLSEKQVYGSFGRQYLQKIIQLQFDIPLQSQKGISTMIDNVIIASESNDYGKLIDSSSQFKKIVSSLFHSKYYSPLAISESENEKSKKTLNYLISTLYLPLRILPVIINLFVYPKWKTPEEAYTLQSQTIQVLFKINFWIYSLFYLLTIPCLFYNPNLGILIIITCAFLPYILLRIITFKKYNKLISDIRNGQQLSHEEIVNNNDLLTISEEIEFKRLEQDSNLFQRVRNEALLYLDSLNMLLPRNAKRITNKIRLFIYIAYKKDPIQLSNKRLPKYIAKWIVFQERWPELYMNIFKHQPRVEMGKIEDATDNDEKFSKYIETFCPRYLNEASELKKFLTNDNVKLSEKLEILLYETNGQIEKRT